MGRKILLHLSDSTVASLLTILSSCSTEDSLDLTSHTHLENPNSPKSMEEKKTSFFSLEEISSLQTKHVEKKGNSLCELPVNDLESLILGFHKSKMGE